MAGMSRESFPELAKMPAPIAQVPASLLANLITKTVFAISNEGSRYNLPGTPFNGLPISGGNDGDGGVDHVLPNLYLTQPIFRGS